MGYKMDAVIHSTTSIYEGVGSIVTFRNQADGSVIVGIEIPDEHYAEATISAEDWALLTSN